MQARLHSVLPTLKQATIDPYLHRDTQTQFCLSLGGITGSWCTQGLFEPSESFWQVWGLILNANSPLLPSCWGFSFAFGHGVSPHSCSSTYHLTGISLTMDVGYLLTASPAKHSHHSWPWTWGISYWLLHGWIAAACHSSTHSHHFLIQPCFLVSGLFSNILRCACKKYLMRLMAKCVPLIYSSGIS